MRNCRPPALTALLDRMVYRKFTERTIVTREAFEADLALTRTRGFGITDQEMIDGLRAVAGVIFDRHDNAVAAISIALPTAACTMDEIITSLGPRIREAATVVSSHLRSPQS